MKKIYLILGASSDIGVCLIEELVRKDSSAVILAHYHSSREGINEIVNKYSEADIRLYKADLSNLNDVQILIDDISKEKLYPTHIINFSASAYRFNRLCDFEVDRLQKDMNIQVYSFGIICKSFIPFMAENKNGRIVAMLSAATKGVPPKNTTEYTIVKYAVWGLLKSLAADYGDMGVCINGISPGMIETKFIKGIGRKIKEFNAEKSPQHRNLQIDDVLPAIMFLLSDSCTYMNGTNLNLTGVVE